MSYDYANLKIFTKSQINGLTKRLAQKRFSGFYTPGRGWNEIFQDAKTIGLEVGYAYHHGESLFFTQARKITKEQSNFGKAWLKKYFFKINGEPRQGKRTQYVSERVLKIAKAVTKFEFVGVAVLASSSWYPCGCVPIYRAYNRKGESFDYSPVHWGKPIIQER